MKVLQVIEQGFRTLVEEQDDTMLWLVGSMRGAGAEVGVLLAGNAACYAVHRQRQPHLAIGDWEQRQPASLPRDICGLLEKDVPVYVLQEDLAERGLAEVPVIPGINVIVRYTLTALYEQADQVWHW